MIKQESSSSVELQPHLFICSLDELVPVVTTSLGNLEQQYPHLLVTGLLDSVRSVQSDVVNPTGLQNLLLFLTLAEQMGSNGTILGTKEYQLQLPIVYVLDRIEKQHLIPNQPTLSVQLMRIILSMRGVDKQFLLYTSFTLSSVSIFVKNVSDNFYPTSITKETLSLLSLLSEQMYYCKSQGCSVSPLQSICDLRESLFHSILFQSDQPVIQSSCSKIVGYTVCQAVLSGDLEYQLYIDHLVHTLTLTNRSDYDSTCIVDTLLILYTCCPQQMLLDAQFVSLLPILQTAHFKKQKSALSQLKLLACSVHRQEILLGTLQSLGNLHKLETTSLSLDCTQLQLQYLSMLIDITPLSCNMVSLVLQACLKRAVGEDHSTRWSVLKDKLTGTQEVTWKHCMNFTNTALDQYSVVLSKSSASDSSMEGGLLEGGKVESKIKQEDSITDVMISSEMVANESSFLTKYFAHISAASLSTRVVLAGGVFVTMADSDFPAVRSLLAKILLKVHSKTSQLHCNQCAYRTTCTHRLVQDLVWSMLRFQDIDVLHTSAQYTYLYENLSSISITQMSMLLDSKSPQVLALALQILAKIRVNEGKHFLTILDALLRAFANSFLYLHGTCGQYVANTAYVDSQNTYTHTLYVDTGSVVFNDMKTLQFHFSLDFSHNEHLSSLSCLRPALYTALKQFSVTHASFLATYLPYFYDKDKFHRYLCFGRTHTNVFLRPMNDKNQPGGVRKEGKYTYRKNTMQTFQTSLHFNNITMLCHAYEPEAYSELSSQQPDLSALYCDNDNITSLANSCLISPFLNNPFHFALVTAWSAVKDQNPAFKAVPRFFHVHEAIYNTKQQQLMRSLVETCAGVVDYSAPITVRPVAPHANALDWNLTQFQQPLLSLESLFNPSCQFYQLLTQPLYKLTLGQSLQLQLPCIIEDIPYTWELHLCKYSKPIKLHQQVLVVHAAVLQQLCSSVGSSCKACVGEKGTSMYYKFIQRGKVTQMKRLKLEEGDSIRDASRNDINTHILIQYPRN